MTLVSTMVRVKARPGMDDWLQLSCGACYNPLRSYPVLIKWIAGGIAVDDVRALFAKTGRKGGLTVVKAPVVSHACHASVHASMAQFPYFSKLRLNSHMHVRLLASIVPGAPGTLGVAPLGSVATVTQLFEDELVTRLGYVADLAYDGRVAISSATGIGSVLRSRGTPPRSAGGSPTIAAAVAAGAAITSDATKSPTRSSGAVGAAAVSVSTAGVAITGASAAVSVMVTPSVSPLVQPAAAIAVPSPLSVAGIALAKSTSPSPTLHATSPADPAAMHLTAAVALNDVAVSHAAADTVASAAASTLAVTRLSPLRSPALRPPAMELDGASAAAASPAVITRQRSQASTLHPSRRGEGWLRQYVHHTGSHFVRLDAEGLLWFSSSIQTKSAAELDAAHRGVVHCCDALSFVCLLLDTLIESVCVEAVTV
jgi:hypothetical protein